jgi:Flp pilus assembly protein CpaB
VLARRRPLAAVLAGLAVLAGVRAYAAPPLPTVAVLTAARDIAPGATVAPDDLAARPFPPAAVPSGMVRSAAEAVGRTTTGPVRAGEPLTDVRLLTDDLLDHHPGDVAAPVRIGDPGSVRLLRVGDRITLYAADPQGEREPVEAASGVPVIAIPRARAEGVSALSGALVVVAVPPETARRLAGLGVSSFLSAVIVR